MGNDNSNFRYWNDVLNDLPESYREWFDAEREFLRANTPAGSKVLELGCGEGRSMGYLQGLPSKLYGVDYNPQAVLQARERFEKDHATSVLTEDGKELPFRDEWFDRVLCLTTPANFGLDRSAFYSEMRRVLKPDGEILLSVFNEDQFTFQERMGLYIGIGAQIKRVSGTTVEFDYPNGASTSEQFSEPQLREIFAENGLTPLEITKQGIGYFCRVRK